MRSLIAVGTASLLLAAQAALAGPTRQYVAQAEPGGPAAPAGTGDVPAQAGAPASPSDPGQIAPPAPAVGVPAAAGPAAGTAATAPATQARQPASANLAPPSFTGTRRNNGTIPSALNPSLGPLPYGGAQATVGVPNPVAVRPYGSTQRDSINSTMGDMQANGGMPTFTGTQSTVGGTQNLGNAGQPNAVTPSGLQPYGNQAFGLQTYGGTVRSNGTPVTGLPPGAGSSYNSNVQGNGTVYSRAPLGSMPVTRDQTGVFGGVGSYNARGVYTGTGPQPLAYGQVYVTNRGVAGGLAGTGVDATGPLRPFIPPNSGPGRPNSGYGLPNGSKPSYIDARGIQRSF